VTDPQSLTAEELLAAAHAAQKRGWRVIPIIPKDKRPADAGWQNTPPMSSADIQATWEDGRYNLGVATGAPSGFWVLDVDPDSGGMESAAALQAEHGKLPTTVVVQTGGGGWHFYFAMPDFDVRNRQSSVLGRGIDVRGTGGQVVIPPSVSDKGGYRWGIDPDSITIPRAPEWLEELLRPVESKGAVYADDVPDRSSLGEREIARLDKYANNIIEREIDRLKECTRAATATGQGYRGPAWQPTTFEVACTLLQLANSPWCFLTEQGAYGFVREFAPRDRGFTDADVDKAFESARSVVGAKARALPVDRTAAPAPSPVNGKVDPFEDPSGGAWAATLPAGAPQLAPAATAAFASPRQWPVRSWDDLGNAMRVVDHYGDRLRWIEQAKRWAIYDGGRWSMDEAQLGRALVQDMIESLPHTEALEYPEDNTADEDGPLRHDFLKWVKSQRMSARISACITEAAGRRELQAIITSFDTQPMLLNVTNGVVDLTTGQLQPHDPSLLLMQQSPVHYDPNATAPRWEQFLAEMQPNPDMRAYLQRVVGYSITGKTGEQALFIHHGRGANGKSVLLQIISALMGSYGQVIPRETLLVKSGGGSEHPTSVARMVGKRFLQASETAAGRRLDEETVKGLTGGEQQTARFMGRDFFDFTPTGKIHFITNHLPRLTDAESIWRRLHFISWPVIIDPLRKDKELANRIIASELPGVLAWAVRGAMEWVRMEGLHMPASAQLHLDDYREDQDVFGDFLQECITREVGAFAATSDLYAMYQAWCNRAGIRNPMMRNDFKTAFADRGFEAYRKTTARGFLGAKINDYGRPSGKPFEVVDDTAVKVISNAPFDPFEQAAG
jgi:putative DNA primase/helicase